MKTNLYCGISGRFMQCMFWQSEAEHVGAGVIGHIKRVEQDERCRSLFLF